MPNFSHIAAAGLAGYSAITSTPWFGGDDPLGPSPDEDVWHHEGLTRRAARSVGWSEPAQNALAFHADRVDAYLYNPMWWFDVRNGGGPARFALASSLHDELIKVHFDDLFDSGAVAQAWRRYLSGTVAALLWLGNDDSVPFENRVQMAQNVVGVSLHAIQDFYSHSNWIDDPGRRDLTWFDVPPDRRGDLPLWTGSYELEAPDGVRPHGDYRFPCTVITGLGSGVSRMLSAACRPGSPLSDTSVCRSYLDCREAEALGMEGVGAGELPAGVIRVVPGINLDSHWQAVIGARERGLDLDGSEAFDVAYTLAYRNSSQWLHMLDHIMSDGGLTELWDAVKTEGVAPEGYKTPVAPFEDPAWVPFEFVSAGRYPPSETEDDTRDWYLRLTVTTAPGARSGTRASIVPIIDDVGFPALEPRMVPGTSVAGVIGPLAEPPTEISLVNRAMTVRRVIGTAGRTLRSRASPGTDADQGRTTVFRALREAIDAPWRLESVGIVAFRRGESVGVTLYEPFQPDRTIGHGEAVTWRPIPKGTYEAQVPDVMDCSCDVHFDDAVPPSGPDSVPRFARRPLDPPAH